MSNKYLLTAGALLLCFSNMLMATPIPPDPVVTPIDGGLSLLVALCAGYGSKKIYDARKEKASQVKED